MNLFEAVKENVTAYDVATMIGLKPNRSKMVCCPFHDDRHPSMKVDTRYYCFGCGAKGDAIDFASNYYGISLKDAAEKLAADFGIHYDNASYTNAKRKQILTRRNEYQQWALMKQELFARISRLHEHLRLVKIKYEPKDREDSEWSPFFVSAVKDFTYVDYLYEYCMFEASEEELKYDYEKIAKEIETIEKRNINTEHGTSGRDAGQVREGMAV